MNKPLALALSWLLIAAPALAESSAHCPATNAIKIRGGVYTAPVGDGGEWLGIAAPGSGGRVQRFDSAILYPAQGGHPARFGKCTYRLQTGLVGLRFKPGNAEPAARRAGANVWIRQEGPFSLVYDECRETDPTQCAFLYTD
ncbi:DUF3757 domain-containing protein [Paludibacterium sp.]|uniref:DUF3757 domain-containing protein n=1 Tax=Paludibacterium sp. TaxID=1917523 RepID=UPI0025E77E68|nr:DUF3757 domain-containing protein [Paludibacterium sp.]MBV8648798.1 DUF3757 domain-containing protein [Paludibacterium sp.]